MADIVERKLKDVERMKREQAARALNTEDAEYEMSPEAAMEAAMNIVDVLLTGGAVLTWWVVPIMLVAGFLTPLPYNYWRLKALGKACH